MLLQFYFDFEDRNHKTGRPIPEGRGGRLYPLVYLLSSVGCCLLCPAITAESSVYAITAAASAHGDTAHPSSHQALSSQLGSYPYPGGWLL